MITARQIIVLGTFFAALAFIASGHLRSFAVRFFNLPTHVTDIIRNLLGQNFMRAIDIT